MANMTHGHPTPASPLQRPSSYYLPHLLHPLSVLGFWRIAFCCSVLVVCATPARSPPPASRGVRTRTWWHCEGGIAATLPHAAGSGVVTLMFWLLELLPYHLSGLDMHYSTHVPANGQTFGCVPAYLKPPLPILYPLPISIQLLNASLLDSGNAVESAC